MTYVDLNPICAGIAKTPEQSDIHPFIGAASNKMIDGIPFRLIDYIELVDWTAREFREGKASMSTGAPPILERLNFDQREWLKACTTLERERATAVGSRCHVEKAKTYLNKSRIHLFKLE